MSVPDIARPARCERAAAYSVIQRYDTTGSAHLLDRPYALDDEDLDYADGVLKANPALYLDELQLKLRVNRDVVVSLATLSRAVYRAGLSWKAISKESAERDELVRAMWRAEYGQIPWLCAVWLDESGIEGCTLFRDHGHFGTRGQSKELSRTGARCIDPSTASGVELSEGATGTAYRPDRSRSQNSERTVETSDRVRPFFHLTTRKVHFCGSLRSNATHCMCQMTIITEDELRKTWYISYSIPT
jgi:transposase